MYTHAKKWFGHGLMLVGLFTVFWFGWSYLSPLFSGYAPMRGYTESTYQSARADYGYALDTVGESLGFIAPTSTAPSFLTKDTGSRGIAPSPVFDEGVDQQIIDRKIVKNGSLTLLVEQTETAIDQMENIAADAGGFVTNLRVYEVSEGVKNGSITVHVPSEQFVTTVNQLKGVAEEVTHEEISTRDVSEQFVDMEARLRNMKAEEAQYLQIMERATTVEDTLKVSQQLFSVRSRIEQLQGQLNYLSRQIDMSAIRVSLTAEADVEVFGLRWRPLVVAKQATRDMLESLTRFTDGFIRFVIFIPIIVLWVVVIGVLYVFIRRIYKRIRKRAQKEEPPTIN